jgi:hypothetical protein
MTYTIQPSCAAIIVSSDIISDFIATNPIQDFTLNITVTRDCTTAFSFDIIMDDLNILDETFDITPDLVGNTNTLQDGVYSIVITKTLNDLSEITTEKECIIIDCELQCCLVDFLADNPTSEIKLFYQALEWVHHCGDCLCDETCTLFSYIKENLNNNGSTTQCGCSG